MIREEELESEESHYKNVMKHATIHAISRRAMHFRGDLRNLASAWVLFTNSTRKSELSSEELIEINSVYEFINGRTFFLQRFVLNLTRKW